MSGGSTGGAYRVIGIESSPYAVKVRAVMRYRRLPHAWVARSPRFFAETQHVRPLIMPVVQYPDGEYRTDSTPILLDLEDRHADRSILPDAPDQAFLALLIEDMADEWLTKSLFHYRFSHAPDRRFAGSWVMDDAHPDIDADELETVTAAFVARQTERMPLVGCTKENGPHFERFYEAVLEILERFVATDRFLFGSRPSIADFGLYGQLSTLSTDPTPGALIRAKAPRALHWIWRTADASGVEGAWRDPAAPAPAHIRLLLRLAGDTYLPFLHANAQALGEGADEVALTLNGQTYRQPPFRYQGKCYSALRARYAALPDDARSRLDPLLDATGCLPWLTG